MDGTVLDANRNFLDAIGYELDEIKGRHHRLFVEAAYAESAEYRAFWETLRSGKHASGEFPRLGKSGRKIWLEATYNPVLGADGKPERVMKFATDITAEKNEASRLLTMIDGMPVAVMTVDPKDEFKINYLNQTSVTTLSTIEEHLPIKVSEMMGRSFDVFHKHPHHQRTMLADSRRLPHRAKIRVGPETLDLRVSAIHGPEGEYVGPMVTWSVITAQVQMSADVSRVVEAVQRMGSSAEELARSAEDARQRAASVAAGSAQMTASIQEISGQVGSVSERAQRIAAQAETTDLTVRQLAENARKVDAVVAMIRSIADQTNLLATIEAARAGAAGRGFAVVAAEVKALAEQTAKATGEISGQIAAIQSATGEAVEAIGTITAAVTDLSGLTLAMASAVEEQAASTHETVRQHRRRVLGGGRHRQPRRLGPHHRRGSRDAFRRPGRQRREVPQGELRTGRGRGEQRNADVPPVTTIGQATQPGAAEGLIVTSALRRFEPVMIDSTRLLPPGFGLSADPVLFGVSDALARLLPLPDDDFAALCQSGTGGGSAVLAPASAEPPSETDPTG